MRKTGLFFCLIIVLCGNSSFARDFRHPGILHTQDALERIRVLVEQKVQPAIGSYDILSKTLEASFMYNMRGPFKNISRAGEYGYTKDPCERDFNAAYYNALMWVLTKDRRYAKKTMEIIRAYASQLQKIYGPDEPLCAGLQGFILVNAAEIIRYTYSSTIYEDGWDDEDTRKVEGMLRNVFQPVLTSFYQTKPYTNGNWGLAVTKAQLAFGVFLNDEKLYKNAVDFFYHGKDNGSLPNYVAENGQIQESGRDQQHCMLGIGCLSEIAEVAWNQGDDLYSALDNRIMKGCEYLAKSNLGYEVPFFTWKDITGKYSNWQSLGKEGIGRFRSVFELAYNHYTERKNLKMPYTQTVLERTRPEGPGFACDNPGFGTLLFYLGNPQAINSRGMIDEYPMKYSTDWIFASAKLLPVNGSMAIVSSGISLFKKGIRYNASEYPFISIKISHMPEQRKKNWLQLSYSVMSAPEFWTFDEKDAVKIENGIYVFRIAGSRSNNGTLFTGSKITVSLMLDFGNTCGEPVKIEYIHSVNNY
ncbi:alginate lyase family protein [uncultured Bacteroides sp.]|uniref:alginate lyase family protein n=1 Tax=uncultured Bacteroides sp. TaxID=162156 RepID=UPI002AA7DD62|nr:alginate lyase family protein [uncultured Bacteroides sp.]